MSKIGREEIINPSGDADFSLDDRTDPGGVADLLAADDPAELSSEQVAKINERWVMANPRAATNASDTERVNPVLEERNLEKDTHDRAGRAEFPWLDDPDKGVAWDFDPIRQRNISQTNPWVGTLVNTIVKEISQTPWAIHDNDGTRAEASKRLTTHPEERTPISKQADDATAREIAALIDDPHPDADAQDLFEMLMADLLEVGSLTAPLAFNDSEYVSNEDGQTVLRRNPSPPIAIQPSAPEVWTKDYHMKTDVLDGYWQFDRNDSPGGSAGGRRSGRPEATFFDSGEVMWSDLNSRSNRRYGMPPTLLVQDFLRSVDLAITQEQNYLSKGSIPSGALVFENWSREELEQWMTQTRENIKGKPHKWLTIAGQQGSIDFEQFSYNFQELQFMERMKWYAKVIASAFQVPTAVVGLEPEKVNYNTFEGERQNFESNTLGPYLQKLERVINDQLVWQFWSDDYRFEFQPGMSEQTRGMISDRVRAEVQAGIRTPNEARESIGLGEADDPEADELGGGDDGGEGGQDLADLVQSVADVAGEDTDDVAKQETYTDYPEAASENAQMALDAREDTGNPEDCGQREGWMRANQLADREAISRETVGRMAAFRRHESNYDPDAERSDCGWMMWKAWGGEAGVSWAEGIVERNSDGETARMGTLTLTKDDAGVWHLPSEKDADQPLRETDDWHEFDVQPGDIEDLSDELRGPIEQFFDELLASDDLEETIASLASKDAAEVAKLGSNDLRRLLDDLTSKFDLTETIQETVRRVAGQAAERVVSDAAQEFDAEVDPDPISEAVRSRDRAVLSNYTDQMAEQILETVEDGWAEGKTSTEIRDDLQAKKEDFTDWGAERVARQELQVATGEARSEFADEINKVEVWQTSEDNRVRDAHSAMQGKWKTPTEDFEVAYPDRGIEKENVPGNSEPGIGCRCFVRLVDREEVDDADHAGVL